MTEYNYFPAIRFRFEGDEQAGRQYIPQARDLMAQMIRRMEAGETDVGVQEGTLPEGIRIRLEKYGDQHIATIRSPISEKVHSKDSKEGGPLCLMVLYDKNKIAAIPMEQLDSFKSSGKFSSAHKHKCKESSWNPTELDRFPPYGMGPVCTTVDIVHIWGPGTVPPSRNTLINCCQAKLGKNLPSILLSGVHVDKNTIQVNSTQSVGIVDAEFNQFIIAPHSVVDAPPLMNSDGISTLYTSEDVFTISSGNLTHEGKNPYPANGGPLGRMAIAPSGETYGSLYSILEPGQFTMFHTWVWQGVSLLRIWGGQIKERSQGHDYVVPDGASWYLSYLRLMYSSALPFNYSFNLGATNDEYEYIQGVSIYSLGDTWVAKFANWKLKTNENVGYFVGEQTNDISLTVPVVTYGAKRGYDEFTLNEVPLSATVGVVGVGGGSSRYDENEYAQFSFIGTSINYSGTYDNYPDSEDFTRTGEAIVIWYPFPPAPTTDSGFRITEYPETYLTTPYGDQILVERSFFPYPANIEWSYGGSSANTAVYENAFTPWMHLSNGKHCIQGIGVIATNNGPVDRYIWLNGKRCEDEIASAIGIDKNDIQMMVMDVPLSRIKQFK